MKYLPTLASVQQHDTPRWFHDAKFGIMVHWGLYSVPAFAPHEKGDFHSIIAKDGVETYLKYNPYVEWYQNSLRIPGSATQEYHAKKYGRDFLYQHFAPLFNRASRQWDPRQWAELFSTVGAQYVVFPAKHHDGFLMWPSTWPNPHIPDYMAARDVVGELAQAVKGKGMTMGLYYSGSLDWTFVQKPLRGASDFITNGSQDPAYVQYATGHWRELIDRYEPMVLFNDIGYPEKADLAELFSYYYNKFPEGAINDRWMQYPAPVRLLADTRFGRYVTGRIVQKKAMKGESTYELPPHCDYTTPEYAALKDIRQKKWETVRGMGLSFAYNAHEPESCYLTGNELIVLLVDIVSKNGNLLLNVGPMADGSIPDLQKNLLEHLGAWLAINGDGIFGTRPWVRAEGKTADGLEVRFTRKGNDVFAFVLGTPAGDEVILRSVPLKGIRAITCFGKDTGRQSLQWHQENDDIRIVLNRPVSQSAVHMFQITG